MEHQSCSEKETPAKANSNPRLSIPYVLPLAFVLSLATFNVQGLSKVVNQHQLGLDCSNYSLDVIALQETKIKPFSDTILPCGNKLIIMEQKDVCYAGLGFIV